MIRNAWHLYYVLVLTIKAACSGADIALVVP
ncbi:DUF3265 domain-containing protein [Vibrio parahaemolyticus]|nr:DUF3265 domain-containing protein [Vibrio parahaemolyticus]